MKKLCLAVGMSFAMATAALAGDVQENWKSKCKSCHGETGKGDTKVGKKEKVDDMSTAEWQGKWSDAKIRTVIAEGAKDNKKMKPFKDKLSPEEIDALVQLIRTFKN